MRSRRSPWAEGATCSTCCACEAAGKAGQAEDPPHLLPPALATPPLPLLLVETPQAVLSVPSLSILLSPTSLSCCTQLLPQPGFVWTGFGQNCVAAAAVS